MKDGALAPPNDLTLPSAGSSSARDVLSLALRRLLQELRPLVRSKAALVPPQDFAAFDQLVTTILRDRAGALATVLRQPNVGALIRTLRRPTSEEDGALVSELTTLLTFELAIMGELPHEVTFRAPPRRWVSLRGELVLDVPEGAHEVTFHSERLTIRSKGAPTVLELADLRDRAPRSGVSFPFHAVDKHTLFATVDNNPLANDEAHPDKEGNAVDLGGASVETWVASLRQAFGLVATFLPDLRDEMDLYVAQIVPVGAFTDKHLSASYREALGTLYLSLHPSPMTMVEALIHEFQHNKLNALFEIDDVLENAFSPLYPSPVRPDPRPLHGVLLAVHAFLPVARLYEAMLESGHPLSEKPGFRERLRDIAAINEDGAETVLAHGRPTRIGRGLLVEIERLTEPKGLRI